MKNTPFDNLVNDLLNALPQSAKSLREDAEKNIRASLEAGLQKLNLVSRSEFDAQSAVLDKTRQQLQDLEKQVSELEKQLQSEK